MNWNLLKKKSKEFKIEYSNDWLNLNADVDLSELYRGFCNESGFNSEDFRVNLLYELKPSFEIPFSDICPVSSSMYFKPTNKFKKLLSSINTNELEPYYKRMMTVLCESYVNFIFDHIKQNRVSHSVNGFKENVHKLCEECFHKLISLSAINIGIILDNQIFMIADTKSIFLEIINETINPEYFREDHFRLCPMDFQDRKNKLHEIAIKHTVIKFWNLTLEKKIGLIPALRENLHSVQDLKLAKGFKYQEIDELENFYQTYLDRFEKEEKRNKDTEREIIIKEEKFFFTIGTTKDIDEKNLKEILEKKKLKFKNIFMGLKYKFSDKPSASNFESLFNPNIEFHEKFNWIGDKNEFLILINFLKEKGIIRQTVIQKVIINRFLINGEKIANSESQYAQRSSKRELNKKSEWVMKLEGI